MKKIIPYLLLLTVFILFLTNCEKEEFDGSTISSAQERPKIIVNKVTLDYLQQKEILGKKIHKIIDVFDINKNSNFKKNDITVNDGSFTILTDKILEVTTDFSETYTFKIKTPTDSSSAFENFVIEKINDGYRYWIYRFIKSTEANEGFPYLPSRQLVDENQINENDFQNFLKFLVYDPISGCLYNFPDEPGIYNYNDHLVVCAGGASGSGSDSGGNDSNYGDGDDSGEDNYYGGGESSGDNSEDNNYGGGGNGSTADTNDSNTDNTSNDVTEPDKPVGVLIDETIFNTENLTPEQKILFDNAKNDLSENCLGAALLGSVTQANITMGATSVGEYNPVTNTISFRSNNDINSTTLGAELMHAYQQQLYGTLSGIYNGTNNLGGSNIEFEEKAFNIKRDLFDEDTMITGDNGISTGLAIGVNLEQWALRDWLVELEFNHPTGSIVLNQSELDAWFNALEEFQQYHEINNPSTHYGDPINYNQNPDAILNLINKTLESNCN